MPGPSIFRQEAWTEALAEEGLDPAFYTHRQRRIDEIFPWEHIDIAVTKKFLSQGLPDEPASKRHVLTAATNVLPVVSCPS